MWLIPLVRSPTERNDARSNYSRDHRVARLKHATSSQFVGGLVMTEYRVVKIKTTNMGPSLLSRTRTAKNTQHWLHQIFGWMSAWQMDLPSWFPEKRRQIQTFPRWNKLKIWVTASSDVGSALVVHIVKLAKQAFSLWNVHLVPVSLIYPGKFSLTRDHWRVSREGHCMWSKLEADAHSILPIFWENEESCHGGATLSCDVHIICPHYSTLYPELCSLCLCRWVRFPGPLQRPVTFNSRELANKWQG